MGQLTEEWRPVTVEPFCDYYEVSNLGRVRRSKRGLSTNVGFVLTPYCYENYHFVHLYAEGKRQRHRIHTLVALAFLGPRPPKHEVDHVDHDPGNNNVQNLRWLHASINCKARSRVSS